MAYKILYPIRTCGVIVADLQGICYGLLKVVDTRLDKNVPTLDLLLQICFGYAKIEVSHRPVIKLTGDFMVKTKQLCSGTKIASILSFTFLGYKIVTLLPEEVACRMK